MDMDKSSNEAVIPAQDVSWIAYNRLHRLEDSDKSSQHSAVKLRKELEASVNSGLLQDSFVPFLHERGSIGQLLRPQEPRKKDDFQGREAPIPIRSRAPIRYLPRLRSSKSKDVSPAVGTYSLPNSFSQKSFSTYKPKPIMIISAKTKVKKNAKSDFFPRTRLVPTYQYTIKRSETRYHQPEKFDSLRPEVAIEQAKRTNFQYVKIADSPEELENALQLQERMRLKNDKLSSVRQLVQQMIKSNFS